LDPPHQRGGGKDRPAADGDGQSEKQGAGRTPTEILKREAAKE
jgi:hypothetical protein